MPFVLFGCCLGEARGLPSVDPSHVGRPSYPRRVYHYHYYPLLLSSVFRKKFLTCMYIGCHSPQPFPSVPPCFSNSFLFPVFDPIHDAQPDLLLGLPPFFACP
ncbi:hypothetical protein F4778DRAFT_237928 [Xylariomycetidae sp. FL2044]|nr:hypothetical protein F4778DRAFT_237928 [Xylariomycetidae sp. FL2044]